MTASFLVEPGGTIAGELRPPGDKSISHRAAIMAGIAEGEARVQGFLHSEDCLATLAAMRQLGAVVSRLENGDLLIEGCAGKPRNSARVLDLGNAGTGIRLLAGVAAGQPFKSVLSGDASLRSRPMNRIVEPLQMMGAEITSDGGRAPLVIHGRHPLQAIDYELPVASAQVKSCLLLAGLFAQGTTSVTSPAAVRDHSERMLRAMGAPISVEENKSSINGPFVLRAQDISVPADFSSAAFFIAAAACLPGAAVTLSGVGINPGRTGLLDVLLQMGADIKIMNERAESGEPVADIAVKGRRLQGVEVDPTLVPAAIDEFPVLFVAAAMAEGTTVVRGAEELRVKESDRIASMARALSELGVEVAELRDGIEIEGRDSFRGGEIDCAGDHRVAMAAAMAGLFAKDTIVIRNVENVATSYPEFAKHAAALGLGISEAGEAVRAGKRQAVKSGNLAEDGAPAVPVITVDGPSGSGKGTVSRRLADELGWHLLDSGALYRLTALASLDAGISPEDENAVAAIAADLDVRFESDKAGNERILLGGKDVTLRIRSERCGEAASRVAPLGKVRDALGRLQRAFRRLPGLVADGRDMGTVVFPDALLKIFLTASADERAERRYKQLNEKGIGVSLAALRADIAERDRRDQSREIAPLVPAGDALIVDTTGVGIDEVVSKVLAEARKVIDEVHIS